jgi:hypothetical protein
MHDAEDAPDPYRFRVEYPPLREAYDDAAMKRLRDDLDAWAAKRNEGEELVRADSIALLRIVVRAAGRALRRQDGEWEPGERVWLDHPAIAHLEKLIGALGDLENGKTHKALRKCSQGATASLWSHEVRIRDGLLEMVDVLCHASPGADRKKIEADLSRMLNSNRSTWRGKRFSPGLLKGLRNRKGMKNK